MRRLFLALAALLLAAPATTAQMLEAPRAPARERLADAGSTADLAYAAYQTGFYLLASQLATSRIQANPQDAAAMTLLGELHRQGLGMRTDLSKAADWYRLATDRGDMNAAFALAMMTLRGEGVARDEARGKALLARAAEKGQPLAAYNLALLLLQAPEAGERARAIALLEQSSAAEIPDAQHALAVLKREGRDTPQDIDAAADLMRRAAQNGLEAGEIEYAIMLFNGRGVGRDERGAADIFERIAARGNALGQNRYARLLAAGRGRPRDAVEASAWGILASRQGLEDEMLTRLFDNLAPADKSRALARAAALAPLSLTAPMPTPQ